MAYQSLSESKAEVDKLLTQLKNQKQSEDAVVASAKKKHATEVRAMQQKVSVYGCYVQRPLKQLAEG